MFKDEFGSISLIDLRVSPEGGAWLEEDPVPHLIDARERAQKQKIEVGEIGEQVAYRLNSHRAEDRL